MQRILMRLQSTALLLLVLMHIAWAILATRHTEWNTLSSFIYESLPFCQVPLILMWLVLGETKLWLRVSTGLPAILACTAISGSAWHSEVIALGLYILSIEAFLAVAYLGWMRFNGYRMCRGKPSSGRWQLTIRRLFAVTTIAAMTIALAQFIQRTTANEWIVAEWIVALVLGSILFTQFASILWATLIGRRIWLRSIIVVLASASAAICLPWMISRFDESLYVWLWFHGGVTYLTALQLRFAGVAIVQRAPRPIRTAKQVNDAVTPTIQSVPA